MVNAMSSSMGDALANPAELMGDVVDEAESSKAGLRRMRLLRAQTQLCRSSKATAIDSTTSNLICPSLNPTSITALPGQQIPTSVYGHTITTLFSPTSPRPLKTPSILPPGKQISLSPNGDWVVMFHSNSTIGSTVGTLAVYKSSILLPSSLNQSNSIVPFASFALQGEPIACVYLYPDRMYLPSTNLKNDHTSGNSTSFIRSPPLGPPPPPSYNASNGPALIILTSDSTIHLIHPHLNPVGNGSSVGVSPSWSLNCLSCSSTTRSFANISHSSHGQAVQVAGGDSRQNRRIRAGWLGLIPNSRSVWAGIDRDGRGQDVVCVDVGVERDGSYYLRTRPLPSLPRLSPPTLPGPPETLTSQTPPISELQGMYFVPVSSNYFDQNKDMVKVKKENVEETEESEKKVNLTERIGVMLIFRDSYRSKTSQSPSSHRTRLELCKFERREIELAEGFKEIESGRSEGGPLYDWIVLSHPSKTSLSPVDVIITSLVPLPAIPPHTLGLATVLLPNNTLQLTHLDLVPISETDDDQSDWWAALRGQQIPVPISLINSHRDLVPSQSVERGALGLVGLVGGSGEADLMIMPMFFENGDYVSPVTSVEDVSDQTAKSIYLAIQQGVGWGDVIRAAFGLLPPSEHQYLARSILSESHQFLCSTEGQEDLASLLKIQLAVFRSTNDQRYTLAAELIRLHEASVIFDQCSTIVSEDRAALFDLDSIWGLIGVAEWVVCAITEVMKDSIVEASRMEWESGNVTDVPLYSTDSGSKAIYLLNPILRRMILTLLSQLQVFTKYIENLELAIYPPESRYQSTNGRDPRMTEMAKARSREIMDNYGLELVTWGKSLEGVDKTSMTDDQTRDSLLTLSMNGISGEALKILSYLPSPSTLFLADPGTFAEADYDAITFEPLPLPAKSTDGSGRRTQHRRGLVQCDRCGWKTRRLRLSGGIGGISVRGRWGRWMGGWEKGCLCGGTWV